MKRLFSVATICLFLSFPARAGFFTQQEGFSNPSVAGGGGTALALDGSAHLNNSTGTLALSLTTTKGSGQIIVVVGTNAASINTPTATGLTFNLRKINNGTTGFTAMSEYVAPYTTNFSGTITVTVASALFTTVDAFGIGNSNTTSGVGSPPFDANASLPATSGSTTATGTTSNATDFVFAFCGLSTSTDTAGTGWTLISGSGTSFMLTEWQIASATGSFTNTTAGSHCAGSILDAIVH